MFKLFQSIFGAGVETQGKYPEQIVDFATERAVDATDPRIRAVGGYKKALRPAIVAAIDHVVALVNLIGSPLGLNRSAFGSSAEVSNFFASVEDMEAMLKRDPELCQWQKSSGALAERVVTLLLAEMHERNTFGVALEGGVLRHDVPQVTVSFSKHRFVDPTGSEEETRKLLRRRAFDHMLSLALAAMAEAHGERQDLERERDLLRMKVAALARGHWGFGSEDGGSGGGEPIDAEALQDRIAELDAQLGALGSGLLQSHLDILADTLSRAPQQLWAKRATLCIDRQGVKQAQPTATAPEVPIGVLHNAAGRSLAMRLVSVERGDLPPPPDFLREAQRYL